MLRDKNGKTKKKQRQAKAKRQSIAKTRRILNGERTSSSKVLTAQASKHEDLINDCIHLFVDDQNLFWGIVNDKYGIGFRIDFSKLLFSSSGERGVKSAYIAGVIPDDDEFWSVAESKGFEVRRGFLGTNGRSKQDDAYLITDMVRTIYTKEGPATIVLVAGDADYVPPLKEAIQKGWRVEVVFTGTGKTVSRALEKYVHEFREISPESIRYN